MARPDVNRVYEDLKASSRYLSKTFKEMKTDFEYALGKQWKDEDKITLDKAGVKALTINKIRPMIKLLSGIERQSRSDFKAFSEGTEDEVLSEIATRLLKNVSKTSSLKNKMSEIFKNGMICGACYIEPYIDYGEDLLNGEMRFRKIEANRILFDPSAEEYDLSDGKFLIKLTIGISEDDVLMLFPDQKDKLDNLGTSNIEIGLEDNDKIQVRDYPSYGDNKENTANGILEKSYDLIEYYYKNPINIYYVISQSQGIIFQSEEKKEAELFIAQSQIIDSSIITKRTYEIRLKQIVGKTEMSDERANTYPRWKKYPIIPFFAERMTVDVEDSDLEIQGVVRGLRDLQEEYNKRRTQELRHLNSSISSGTFVPKNCLDQQNKNLLKKYGSSPGVSIEFDIEKTGGFTPDRWRISPAPLSQGHAQLAAENAQDIKEASGVNPDLLANDSQSQSGRAILLKQRQGLVMVQEPLDNYQQTKEIVGRFTLSQLGEIFSIESAMQVLGDGFLNENFKKPVFDINADPVLENGVLKTEPDIETARLMINKVLTDSSIGKYDVTIGEGTFNETIQIANFTTMMDMAKQGIPIPPSVIVEESLLSNGQKEKIQEYMDKVQYAQSKQVAQV